MKSLLTTFAFFACTLALSAQLSLGLQTQVGESWQYYGDEVAINGFDQRISHYAISAQLLYQLSPNVSIGIAPGYARRGAACFPGFTASPDPVQDATIYANYLQFPVLVQWEQPLGGHWSTFAEIGAGFSYLLNGHWDLVLANTIELPPAPETQTRDIDFGQDNFINRYDFALQANLGLAYRLGLGQLRLGAGYYHGFLDVNDNNTSENRAWSVQLGYRYDLLGQ
ncbi:MAG: outer membrane beta-barrel protein [Bacteroidota bacterium]